MPPPGYNRDGTRRVEVQLNQAVSSSSVDPTSIFIRVSKALDILYILVKLSILIFSILCLKELNDLLRNFKQVMSPFHG
ncbi:hypothetical protein K3495_g16510 [Podosphaera aphanis]|nr:hypothetical protein K3495_g16510 [Podosphaera aphanis]